MRHVKTLLALMITALMAAACYYPTPPPDDGWTVGDGSLDTAAFVRHHHYGPNFNFKIPASQLAEWRRQAVGALLSQPARQTRTRILYDKAADHADASTAYTTRELDYTANVANRLARDYYTSHGISRTAPAYELRPPHEAVLMTCRHCLRAELGHCARRHDAPAPWREPLALRLPDGRRFPLSFDCRHCQMLVHAPR